jgi:isopenicillin N synthase-like dioxygenase
MASTSNTHRVLTDEGTEWFSIPFIYEPSFDTVVECFEVYSSKTNPPESTPSTTGKHLLNMCSQTHSDSRPE